MSRPTEIGHPPVTVAVVSWNTREPLARCLESLRADAEAAEAAVWVVDNISSPNAPGGRAPRPNASGSLRP